MRIGTYGDAPDKSSSREERIIVPGEPPLRANMVKPRENK
jgi:hypothetical protein